MRALVIVGVLAMASRAHADDTKTADEKFEAAQKLREQGKVKDACALFAESLALNANAIGTILNVARCAEEDGKVATAMRYFTDARDRAKEQNLEPQRQAAEEHLAKLSGRAPHLAIAFAEPPVPGTTVVIDDHVVDPKSYADVLIDPGTSKVVVSAPGRVQYNTTVTIKESERAAVAIPRLALPVTVKSTRATAGKVMVVVGGVAIIGAEVIALAARSSWKDAINRCNKKTNMDGSETFVCDAPDYNQANTARNFGDAATGIGIAGVVIGVAGAALWWFAPRHEDEQAPHMAIVPVIGPGEAGIVAFRRF